MAVVKLHLDDPVFAGRIRGYQPIAAQPVRRVAKPKPKPVATRAMIAMPVKQLGWFAVAAYRYTEQPVAANAAAEPLSMQQLILSPRFLYTMAAVVLITGLAIKH